MTIPHTAPPERTAASLDEVRAAFTDAQEAAAMVAAELARLTGPRALHDVCEAARQVPCGHCWGDRGQSCGFTGTRARPVDGWHLQRFARARRKGLLSEADMATVLEAAGDVLTPGSIIWDETSGGAR